MFGVYLGTWVGLIFLICLVWVCLVFVLCVGVDWFVD